MRAVTSFVLGVFTLALLPAPSIAATPGARCPKAAQVVKTKTATLVCTRAGSRLVWRVKSRVTNRPTDAARATSPHRPQAAPHVSVDYTPSAITVMDVVGTIEASLPALWAKAPEQAGSVKLTIQPGYESTEWVKGSVDSIRTAMRLTGALDAIPRETLDIYIGYDETWLRSNKPGQVCGYVGMGGACGQNVLFAGLEAFVKANGSQQMWPLTSPPQRMWILGNLPHEVGHASQMELDARQGAEAKQKQPAWLREGFAEVFKIISFAKDNNLTYAQSRAAYLDGDRSRCNGARLSDMTASYSAITSATNSCEYDKGMVATEYLIWRTGGDVAMGLRFLQKGDEGTAAEIFERAYGMTLERFLKEAEAYWSLAMAAPRP